jgi:hypothetical protein
LFEKIETNNVIKNNIGDLPATTAVLSNNQIGKYISRENATILKNVFSATANGFGRVFYQPYEFTILQDSYAFKFKNNDIDISKIHSFIVGILNKIYQKYNWGNKSGWAKIKQEKISLPVKKDREIDFAFMEDFISQLEAYLLVTGLKNYTLTPAEEQALTDFQNGNIKWGEFKVVDLFDVKTSKKRFDANKVKVLQVGYPYVVRTALNNGIKGFLNENEKYLNLGNTISFGQDTATIFYQEKPYFTGDKIKILEPKHKFFGKKNAQFIITVMEQSFRAFSWGSYSFSEEVIKTQNIYIPIQKEEINFEYMETLISTVQKLVIKDVVEYADRKIEATREIIHKK